MKGNGETQVKGRIICPKCKNEFIFELIEDKKIFEVVCPKCTNKFNIETKCKSEDLEWEEHGEPRKTILSCIKPHSNKPLIAIVLLVCVFLIGISTAVFYDVFIQTTSYASFLMNFLKDNIGIGSSIIIVIFSVFAIIALFACNKRKYFILAIAGSFIAIFSFGFFFICSILSIIAFVIIYRSRDEFEDEKKGKIF